MCVLSEEFVGMQGMARSADTLACFAWACGAGVATVKKWKYVVGRFDLGSLHDIGGI